MEKIKERCTDRCTAAVATRVGCTRLSVGAFFDNCVCVPWCVPVCLLPFSCARHEKRIAVVASYHCCWGPLVFDVSCVKLAAGPLRAE